MRNRKPETSVAWIPTDQAAEPGGLLARVTAEVRRARGSVANIFAVHSIHPEIMRSHLRLYRDLMFGPSDLSREERETVALAVSVVNGADYCIHHHGAALCELTGEAELVDAVVGDPDGAPVDERRRCLVRYALKLTRSPTSVLERDILEMRAAGLSDRAIPDAAVITAYFNFVNRIALGLGVRLEPHVGW